MHNKEAKLLASDTFLSRKNVQKCVCGRGSALTPLGELTVLPDPLTGNGGGPTPGRGRERERRGGKGRGVEGKVREARGVEGRDGKGRGRAIPPNENPGYGRESGTVIPAAFHEIS